VIRHHMTAQGASTTPPPPGDPGGAQDWSDSAMLFFGKPGKTVRQPLRFLQRGRLTIFPGEWPGYPRVYLRRGH